jgi:hypothetical protein
MPKYDDDQCVRCGSIRVAKSTLCVDCLVAAVNSFGSTLDLAGTRIEELEEKNKKLTALCERLLDHITQDMIAMSDVDEQIRHYRYKV